MGLLGGFKGNFERFLNEISSWNLFIALTFRVLLECEPKAEKCFDYLYFLSRGGEGERERWM